MSVRFLLVACLALGYVPCSANGQCIPKPDSTKQEMFSSVKNLQVQGVNVGPAGIELSLEERGDHVIATFRDYAGSSNPIKTTKLQGTLEESGSECKISLFGHNRHGKMEIRGTIGIADFQGTVIRQVGKDMFSERVALRRKLAETDVRIGMLSEGVSPRAPAPFLPDQAIVVETSPLHSKPTNRIPIYVRLKLISAGLVLAVVGMARNSLVHKDAPSECLHCSIDT